MLLQIGADPSVFRHNQPPPGDRNDAVTALKQALFGGKTDGAGTSGAASTSTPTGPQPGNIGDWLKSIGAAGASPTDTASRRTSGSSADTLFAMDQLRAALGKSAAVTPPEPSPSADLLASIRARLGTSAGNPASASTGSESGSSTSSGPAVADGERLDKLRSLLGLPPLPKPAEPVIPPSLLAAARREELIKKLTAAGVIGMDEADHVKDLDPTVVDELRLAFGIDDVPPAAEPAPHSTPNPAKRKSDDCSPADSSPFSPLPKRMPATSDSPIRLGAELDDELAVENAALRDQCASTEAKLKALQEQLSALERAPPKPPGRGKAKKHEIGVLDGAARNALSRSARNPKSGDRVFYIYPVDDQSAYAMDVGHVDRYEDPWVYIALPSPDDFDLTVDRDPDIKVIDVHWVFTTDTLAKKSLVALNDLLLLNV